MSTATDRITIDEYHAMADRGELRPNAKDYLWRGEIVEVMPENPPHAIVVYVLGTFLRDLYPGTDWMVREEKSLVLGDDTEPVPDLLVVRGHWRQYLAKHPTASDVELVVEVAHTSRARDLGEKLAVYATAGILRYWVADAEYPAILAFWDPDTEAARYRSTRIYTRGDAAETSAGNILVNDIFP